MTANLREQAYESERILYMALELSNRKWRLALSDGVHRRQKTIGAGGELLRGRARWVLAAPGAGAAGDCEPGD
jgi:hypothetical protein